MDKHCAEYLEKTQNTIDEAGATAESTLAANAITSDIRKAHHGTKRVRKRRPVNMLPTCDIVEMAMCGKPRFPS